MPNIGCFVGGWIIESEHTFHLATASESRDYVAFPWSGERCRTIDYAYGTGAEAACVASNDIWNAIDYFIVSNDSEEGEAHSRFHCERINQVTRLVGPRDRTLQM